MDRPHEYTVRVHHSYKDWCICIALSFCPFILEYILKGILKGIISLVMQIQPDEAISQKSNTR